MLKITIVDIVMKRRGELAFLKQAKSTCDTGHLCKHPCILLLVTHEGHGLMTVYGTQEVIVSVWC